MSPEVMVCVCVCVLLMFRLYTEIKSEHSPKGCLCFKRCFVSKTKRKEGQTEEKLRCSFHTRKINVCSLLLVFVGSNNHTYAWLISLPATAFILLLVFYISLFGLNNVNQGNFQRAQGARRVSWIEEVNFNNCTTSCIQHLLLPFP